MSLGFEMAGFEGLCGVDFNKSAIEIYQRNFDHRGLFGDITDENVKEEFISYILDKLDGRELDVLCGGFPCQSFSLSGRRLIDDPRNNLYKEMVHLCDVLRPRFIVAENVKGILSKNGGKVVPQIIEDFKDIGYEMKYQVLNAYDYGVPQKRERVIFVGRRLDVKSVFQYPDKLNEYKTVKDSIYDLQFGFDETDGFFHKESKHTPKMVERMSQVPVDGYLYPKFKQVAYRLNWDKPCKTISDNHGFQPLHPFQNRSITCREMARLQSFPDSFRFYGTQAEVDTMIGNAVPPLLAKAIGESVMKSIINSCIFNTFLKNENIP